MRILTGFLPPSEGKTSIDGMDIFDEPETVKTMLGYLPENPPLYPELTVLEYLRFVAELRRVPRSLRTVRWKSLMPESRFRPTPKARCRSIRPS